MLRRRFSRGTIRAFSHFPGVLRTTTSCCRAAKITGQSSGILRLVNLTEIIRSSQIGHSRRDGTRTIPTCSLRPRLMARSRFKRFRIPIQVRRRLQNKHRLRMEKTSSPELQISPKHRHFRYSRLPSGSKFPAQYRSDSVVV